MPISSQAPKGEGSETRAQARRLQAEPKRPAPTATWGDDIVRSRWKQRAVQDSFEGHYTVTSAGCWEWTGGRSHEYGLMRVREVFGDTPLYAHRISYLLHHGPIPAGWNVCHVCDNRACVNPDHLFAGTQADNIADMVSKNRQSAGMKNGQAKLTDTDLHRLLALRDDGVPQWRLAEIFGVSQAQVSRIVRNRHWRTALGKRQCLHGNACMTEADVNLAHDLFEQGMRYTEIAKHVPGSKATVRDAILGRTWRSIYLARRRSSEPT